MKRITVLLAEDHMVVREGLGTLLEAENHIEFDTRPRKWRQARLLFYPNSHKNALE